MDLLLATRNSHKTREFRDLLGRSFQVRDLNDVRVKVGINETGSTFEENASIKAVTISRLLPSELVMADDSGLQVDALGGAPGIYSARYAGEHTTDAKNIEKLLDQTWGKFLPCDSPKPQVGSVPYLRAQFYCAIALARAGDVVGIFTGEVAGHITERAHGAHGFGYDPVFVPDGFEQTFAELPAATKNQISHRAQAAAKLREFLKERRPND